MTDTNYKYNNMLQEKHDYKKVGWGSISSQNKRFEILTQIGDLNDKSILDVGCGLGALLEYLNKNYPSFNYCGSDVNLKMIKGASDRHPNSEFIKTDIVSQSTELRKRKFDYVFLSGALNLSEDNHLEYIQKIMSSMYAMSISGVALNFLSIFSDYFSPGEYYANPETILKIAFSLTSKVVLRHDYMSHDFSIYLYK